MDAEATLISIITSATVTTAIVAIAQKLLTSKIELRQQEKIEAIKGQISRRYQEEIEVIKSKLATDIEQVKYLNTSLSSIYLSSNQERVSALKAAWQLFIEAKSHQPVLVMIVCDLMRKQDAQNLSQPPSAEVGRMIKDFSPMDYFNKVAPINNEINKLKPFIGLEIWGLITTYTTIVSRISLEIGESIIKEFRKYYWLDDEHLITTVITKVMTVDKLNEIVKQGGFRGLIDYLELEIVEHINSQLTGKAFSLAHVQLASEIKSGADALSK